MTLEEFLRHYLALRPVSNGYAGTLAKRTSKLVSFAGRDELAAVFNETTINAFLQTLDGLSPFTVNKYRADFLAIWRAAADEDLVPYPQARRIRRLRTVAQVIECYIEHEARALAVAAEHLPGAYANGVARRHYWPAIIRAAWDSGLRRGDLWKLDLSSIRHDRTAVVIQSKTGTPVICRFHRSTVKSLQRAGGHLQWTCCHSSFGIHFQQIVELSGLRKGSFRWLRRGSGSLIDADHPGMGHEHLGNGRPVFERHYNAKLGRLRRPMVKEL